VAAFAVRGGAPNCFHREGHTLGRNPGGEAGIGQRPRLFEFDTKHQRIPAASRALSSPNAASDV